MHIADSATDIKSSDFSAHPQKNQFGFVFLINYTENQIKAYYCFLVFHLLSCLLIWIRSGQDPFLPITCSKPKISKSQAPWKHAAAAMFTSAVWQVPGAARSQSLSRI